METCPEFSNRSDSNVPTGFVSFIICQIFVRSLSGQDKSTQLSIREKFKQFDFLGAVLIIGALCCLLLALQWGGTTYPWRSSQVIGLLIGFLLLLIAFAVLQLKLGESATIPTRIMRQRTVLFGCLFLFFMQTSAYIVGSHLNQRSIALSAHVSAEKLLSAILLPSRARSFCHRERSSVHSNSGHSGLRHHHGRCDRDKDGTLCKSLFTGFATSFL